MENNSNKSPISGFQETQTVPLVPQSTQKGVELKNSSNRKSILIIIGIILVFLVFIVGGYFLVMQKSNKSDNKQISIVKPAFTPTPIEQPDDDFLGLTETSYAVSNGEVLIKTRIDLIDEIVKIPNIELHTFENVYLSDTPQNYEPNELENINISEYSWENIISRKIDNPTNAKSVLVSDHLFSFKQMPNTDNFLFVIEWLRHAGDGGAEAPITDERTLYLFDSNKRKAIEVMTFNKNNQQYAYPKIDTISSDGKYVSFKLFGCWGCGGHQPETLLLDLQSLESNNIGKVVEFAWTQDGGYQYKDYIEIECQPGPGNCEQAPDLNTLPLKTGSMN